MVTCSSSDRGFRGVHAVAMDRLGSAPPLFGPAAWSRFNDCIHVLHQLQLLPPEVLLLNKLFPGLVLLLPDTFLLCFQSEETEQRDGGAAKRHDKECIGSFSEISYHEIFNLRSFFRKLFGNICQSHLHLYISQNRYDSCFLSLEKRYKGQYT